MAKVAQVIRVYPSEQQMGIELRYHAVQEVDGFVAEGRDIVRPGEELLGRSFEEWRRLARDRETIEVEA
jgi:hypothetical protein